MACANGPWARFRKSEPGLVVHLHFFNGKKGVGNASKRARPSNEFDQGKRKKEYQRIKEVTHEGPVVLAVAYQGPADQIAAEHLDELDPGRGYPTQPEEHEQGNRDPEAVEQHTDVGGHDAPGLAREPPQKQRDENDEQDDTGRVDRKGADGQAPRDDQGHEERREQLGRGGDRTVRDRRVGLGHDASRTRAGPPDRRATTGLQLNHFASQPPSNPIGLARPDRKHQILRRRRYCSYLKMRKSLA